MNAITESASAPQLSSVGVRQTRRKVSAAQMTRIQLLGRAVVIASWLTVCACVDRGPTHPVTEVAILCEGSWAAAPLARGPGVPPNGFERLEISIDEYLVPDETPFFHTGVVYARGTIAWNGIAWPMSLELNDDVQPYCRYAPGHPFHGSADPDGVIFRVFVPDAPFESVRSLDQLLINHDLVAPFDPNNTFEGTWYCYEREGA